jgi:hypothetical protein
VCIKFWYKKQNERDNYDDLIIERIIQEELTEVRLQVKDWIHLDQDREKWRALVKTNETLGSTKYSQFLEWLSKYYLFKKDSAPCPVSQFTVHIKESRQSLYLLKHLDSVKPRGAPQVTPAIRVATHPSYSGAADIERKCSSRN